MDVSYPQAVNIAHFFEFTKKRWFCRFFRDIWDVLGRIL